MSASPPEGVWTRLDRRCALATGLVGAGVCVAAGVPTVAGIARDASVLDALSWVAPIALAVVVLAAGGDLVRARRTAYRVGPDRFELCTTLLGRRVRTLPRDRIRVVDLTGDPVSRVLGLVTVRVSTGDPGSEPVRLRSVDAEAGRRLRETLLPEGRPGGAGPLLAAARPAWLAYGPLSFLTPALGLAAVGGLLTVAGWFDLQAAAVTAVLDRAEAIGPALAAPLAVVVVLGVGAVGALAVTVEAWWAHHLTREDGGMLRVRRGLLTTRSISIEQRRVRGVELVEPWGARLAGGARVDVLVTGFATDSESAHRADATVLPVAPRAVAVDVAASVLGVPDLDAPLRAHPLAARRRRRVRALAAVAVTATAGAVLGILVWAPLLGASAVVLVLGVPGALTGADAAYRALGHTLADGHLVVRRGVLRRATAVLRSDAVLGVVVRSTPLQRRAGLATLVVATAAGSGAVTVPDLGAADALTLAGRLCPEAVAPFRAEPAVTPA